MGFKKGNQFGKDTKRGKGKKTIVKEAITNLEKAGIKVFDLTSDLIKSLSITDKTTLQEKELLFKILQSMYKYDSLTKNEQVQVDQLLTDVQEIKEKQDNFILGTTNELLTSLKNGDK